MLVPIVGLSVSAVLTFVYMFFANYNKNSDWRLAIRLITTMSYVFLVLFAMVNHSASFNLGYMFIVLGLIFVIIADITAEYKDRPKSGRFLMNFSAVLHVAFKSSFIAAIVYFIGSEISMINALYVALLAIAFMVLSVLFLRFVIKLNLHGQVFNVVIYFTATGIMTVLYVWHAILVPAFWPLAVFAGLLAVNDFLLIIINFADSKRKSTIYFVQCLSYYLALAFLVYFMYFNLVGLLL